MEDELLVEGKLGIDDAAVRAIMEYVFQEVEMYMYVTLVFKCHEFSIFAIFEHKDSNAAVSISEAERLLFSDLSWLDLRVREQEVCSEEIDQLTFLQRVERRGRAEFDRVRDIPGGRLKLLLEEKLTVSLREQRHDFDLGRDGHCGAISVPRNRVLSHHAHVEAQVFQLLRIAIHMCCGMRGKYSQ